MRDATQDRRIQRAYLAILGGAAIVAALSAAVAATLAGTSSAAPAIAPNATAEPEITGTPRVGQVLRTTRGTWAGTQPITYVFRWFRCEGRGAPDASDCQRIANAPNATYVLRQADAGFRIRSQVTATNADGSGTATSNPTAAIQSARPTNTTEPSISGSAAVGNRLTANRGDGLVTRRSRTASSGFAATRPGTTAARSPGQPTTSTWSSTATSAARSAFA